MAGGIMPDNEEENGKVDFAELVRNQVLLLGCFWRRSLLRGGGWG